jgi:hypothetical protein
MVRATLALTIAVLVIGLSSPAASAGPTRKKELQALMARTVNYAGMDDVKATFSEILDELATQYDTTFSVNEKAFAADGVADVFRVTLVADGKPLPKLKNVAFETLLRKILSRIPCESGATCIVRNDEIEITTRKALNAEVYGDGPEREFPLASADYAKKPLNEAIDELAKTHDFNIVIDSKVADDIKATSVTANLGNVPLDNAVRLLADAAGLKVVLVGNVLYVTTRENAKELEAEEQKRKEAADKRRKSEDAEKADEKKEALAQVLKRAKMEALKAKIEQLQAEIDKLKAELDKSK